MDTVKEMLEFNKKFVEDEGYKEFEATVFPDKGVVIVTCMDSRLVELLPKALGIKNGEVKMVKNAGGVVADPFSTAMRSILVTVYEFDVKDVLIIGHEKCGMAVVDKGYVLDKMTEKGIKEETIDTIINSGIDIKGWLAGFDDLDESVRDSVKIVKNHPLLHKDVRVTGMVIDPETGKLRIVE